MAAPAPTPQADLYDDHGKLIVTHFAGPSWRAKDGSTVVARRDAGVNMDVTAIDLLAAPHRDPAAAGFYGGDDARLSATTYIQRIATTGRLDAPASAFATRAPSAGQVDEVPLHRRLLLAGRSRARSPSKKSPARLFFDGLLARPAARCAANRPDLPPMRGREHDAQA